MGRKNVSGHKIDKESYDYYKRNYAAQLSYYKDKGYDRIEGLVAERMTKDEWEAQKLIYGKTNKELIYSDFHKWNKDAADALSEAFKKSGFTVDASKRGQLSRGQLSANEWDALNNMYWEYRNQGYDSSAAKKKVSQYFFGSE